MALQCQVTLNYASMTAGQTPAPQATLTVYNPNASAVLVTGANIYAQTLSGQRATSINPPTVPLIAGQSTVPALSSLTFGPFAITIPSMGNGSMFQHVEPVVLVNSAPANPQPSQPSYVQFQLGALVYGSDGSVNTAGVAPLMVSFAPPPPMNWQGGPLQFSAPNNLALGFASGVL
jgi:hypothetical protein